MPRSQHISDPVIVNFVHQPERSAAPYLEIATGNKNKLAEFQRMLPDYHIVAKDLDPQEIQSLDPVKVASQKAKDAFRLNEHNPILVEDTSLEIKGLGGRPGTYIKDFAAELEMRRLICTSWLAGKDRAAVAKVVLAIFDGKEVYTWTGEVAGHIAEEPIGTDGFGWDDIFIPAGSSKTFAQMSAQEKDKYSMRAKAIQAFLQEPFNTSYPVLQLPEPYTQELQRVRANYLTDPKAVKFAYSLESLERENKPSPEFAAAKYALIQTTSNSFFSRYLHHADTTSLGLMLTDVDRTKLKFYENGNPVLWQMGPERRHLALVQRAEYFLSHQNAEVHKVLDDLENDKANFPTRTNRRSITVEQALGIKGYETVTQAVSLKEIGYKKISASKEVSRTKSAKLGLYNMVGKHARSIYGVGCLPFISGWRDVIVTAAVSHILTFVHRNNLNAIDFQNQVRLIKSAKESIANLKLSKAATQRAYQNIGAALGCNPKLDLERAKILYKEAGVTAFRIYTINSDPRVVETAKALRQEFGDKVEIFAGQVVDKVQCQQLIHADIRVDGLVFGHGGGRQCTSATNGMALATLEELYSIVTDRQFNHTSILVEGGLGTSVGAMLIMGIDCILRNAQFASCVIEQGELYFEHRSGEICQPYHGSASAPTMIIESYNPDNMDGRLFYSGRTKNVEGKSGYMYYQERANSMAFYVEEFKHYAARTLADLGVESIRELREFTEKNHSELLRMITSEARYTSSAYGS